MLVISEHIHASTLLRDTSIGYWGLVEGRPIPIRHGECARNKFGQRINSPVEGEAEGEGEGEGEGQMPRFLTETPVLGPLKEISLPSCSHRTLVGGLAVWETTQVKFTMDPTSTNMSGPPIM